MLSKHRLAAPLALVLLVGCGDAITPPESASIWEGAPSLAVDNGDPGRRIFLRDHCGGESWAPFGGCLIEGTVERPEWLAHVQETGSHPLWKNSPVSTAIETGTTLEVVNVGGRGHTFTRVASFGGGILPILNTREDTRIPAPECFRGIVNIRGAGGSVMHTFTGVGEQHFQCCFHPWMRTTVKVTEAHGH